MERGGRRPRATLHPGEGCVSVARSGFELAQENGELHVEPDGSDHREAGGDDAFPAVGRGQGIPKGEGSEGRGYLDVCCVELVQDKRCAAER